MTQGTVARMLEVAAKEVGYIEAPDNLTKYGAMFKVDGFPWCGSFLNWCAKNAGVEVPKVISVIEGAKRFKALGQYHTSNPQVGDFAFFDFVIDNKITLQHIGLVEKVQQDSIITIEGNTSRRAGPHGQANGGEVMRKTRKIGPHQFVVGYGRPLYIKETP